MGWRRQFCSGITMINQEKSENMITSKEQVKRTSLTKSLNCISKHGKSHLQWCIYIQLVYVDIYLSYLDDL